MKRREVKEKRFNFASSFTLFTKQLPHILPQREGGVLVENIPSALVTNSYRPFPISCTPYNSSDYRNEEVVNFNFVFSTHISTHSAFVGRVSSKIVSTNREIEHFRNFSTSRQLSYKHNISTHSTFLSAKRTHISTAACGTRQSRRFKNLPNFLPLSHTL